MNHCAVQQKLTQHCKSTIYLKKGIESLSLNFMLYCCFMITIVAV